MSPVSRISILIATVTICACGAPSKQVPKAEGAAAEATPAYNQISREAFNRAAAELFLPLFWSQDSDSDGTLDPDELAILWGFGDQARERWLTDGGFTPELQAAYLEAIRISAQEPDAAGLDPAEARRRAAIRDELRQGYPTLVGSDFSDASETDRGVVRHVLEAARLIEQLYAHQNGVTRMAESIPKSDPASRMVFFRNQGPWCRAPRTESNPDCNALPAMPARRSGLYPPEIQTEQAFCETLAEHPEQEEILSPFVVVRESDGGDLEAVPYNVVYKDLMEAVARELEAAAALLGDDEAAFRAYLEAAAKAHRDNSWEPADEAWSRMNVHNSRWYLRIGPDEVGFDPCNRKAGFHVSFARINQASLEWQNLLEPVKNDLEAAIAELAGPPYKARKVSFHLPDFVDMVLNAGDSRSAHGATIGQSLPNWGPVANEGRGRTVVMTNLYTDADSIATRRRQVESLFCKESIDLVAPNPEALLVTTILHEAAHNLGPSAEYRVGGKTDDEIFGGPLASVLEELKAQAAALYLTDWLADKGLITKRKAAMAHGADITWMLGHISRGMHTATGRPKPYSQLSAVLLGSLIDDEAVTWSPDRKAANGEDEGCFELHVHKFPATDERLMAAAAGFKARGDIEAARELLDRYVPKQGESRELHETIAARWLRAPKATFVYSVVLGE